MASGLATTFNNFYATTNPLISCHQKVISYMSLSWVLLFHFCFYFETMPLCVSSCFSLHYLTCPFPSSLTSPVPDPLVSVSVYLAFALPALLVSSSCHPSASVCLFMLFCSSVPPVSPVWYILLFWFLVFSVDLSFAFFFWYFVFVPVTRFGFLVLLFFFCFVFFLIYL